MVEGRERFHLLWIFHHLSLQTHILSPLLSDFHWENFGFSERAGPSLPPAFNASHNNSITESFNLLFEPSKARFPYHPQRSLSAVWLVGKNENGDLIYLPFFVCVVVGMNLPRKSNFRQRLKLLTDAVEGNVRRNPFGCGAFDAKFRPKIR